MKLRGDLEPTLWEKTTNMHSIFITAGKFIYGLTANIIINDS